MARYVAVRDMDVGTCQELDWNWTAIRAVRAGKQLPSDEGPV